jgi:hypothetical protein
MAAWMLPAAIGGAALLGYKGAQDTNAASAQAAQAQIDFQREMSNTAFQRQVQDLKSAGINPMMATHLGGSSTPQGAMPQFINPGAVAAQSAASFGSAVSSAASAEQMGIQGGLTKAQIKQVDAATDKIREEIQNIPLEGNRLKQLIFVMSEQESLYRAQGYEALERIRMHQQTIKKLVEETKVIGAEASAIHSLNNLGREYGQLKPLIDTVIGVMKGLK